VGVSASTVDRWRTSGQLNLDQAMDNGKKMRRDATRKV
jgi:hypothetical protein